MVLPTGGRQGPDSETSVRVGHCTTLEGGRCLACKEDIELEFQERRRAIRTRMNANHDPFILKLPPEIGSHIFLLSMGHRDIIDVSQKGKGLPTPFLLGAVCQGWRQLARSTPRLWTRLGFDFFDTTDPTSKTMEVLPQLVSDWLERSGGLPLTLYVSFEGNCETPPEGSVSIINALNKHSGRWHQVNFALPRHYLERLCDASPPELLCNLTISDPDGGVECIPLTFKMNASPMEFNIGGFLLDAVDISWENLVNLQLNGTTIDGVLKVLRNAPLLEKCSLSDISPPIDDLPIPETMIRLPYLHTLEVSWIEGEVFHTFIDSLGLPSLESWVVDLENLVVDNLISVLERSGCSLKSLTIWQDTTLAIDDLERFFQAMPRLRRLRFFISTHHSSSMMDYILEHLAAPPQHPTLQTDVTAGFLSDLQSLTLSGREFNAWACIPLIYRWPHRKLLDLYIGTRMKTVTIDREVSSELVQLVDQGIKLRISFSRGDYIQKLRESTGT